MGYRYEGTELGLFEGAVNWKGYVRAEVGRYLGRRVLEVGAGHGGTTRALIGGGAGIERWVGLEPDGTLAGRLAEAISAGMLPLSCEVVVGTLGDIPDAPAFDTVLYMDVLEHIEDDAGELSRAARRLVSGGYLVVLAPAHPWLYTPFDRAIGHYRRYTRGSLGGVARGVPGLSVVRMDYLDSVGLLASAGNRLVLRSAAPTAGQIAVWDGVMVRMSRVLDRFLWRRVGKSVLGVWRKGG